MEAPASPKKTTPRRLAARSGTDENAVMPDVQTYERALSDDMEKALDTLSDREKLILSLYFGLTSEEPLTLEEIGK